MSEASQPRHNSTVLFFILAAAALASLAFTLFLKHEAAPLATRGGLGPGHRMPEVEAEGWLNGAAPTPASLKGKVLVVDAWASWCGPCLAEAPHIVAAYDSFHSRGVEFIGLTGQAANESPDMQRFIDKASIPWPCGYGAQSTLLQLDVQMIPQVWVVGVDGKIRWNLDSKGSLEDAIEEALASAKGAQGASELKKGKS